MTVTLFSLLPPTFRSAHPHPRHGRVKQHGRAKKNNFSRFLFSGLSFETHFFLVFGGKREKTRDSSECGERVKEWRKGY